MSNRRFILFFLIGIAVCMFGLWGLSVRARVVASDTTRHVLCPSDPDTIDALSVNGTNDIPVTLIKRAASKWDLVTPYAAPADNAPVMQLLDVMTLTPIEDMRTEDDLHRLGAGLADFGLKPPRTTFTLSRGAITNRIHFGTHTASGKEIYAQVEGLMNVFTLPADVVAAVPVDADSFRPRALLSCLRDDISGIEFRMPDAPFVKLIRDRTDWKLSAPAAAPADAATVMAFADKLVAARIAHFVMPSTQKPLPSGTPPDGVLPSASLTEYGLGTDEALTVTVRMDDGTAETILFGNAADTNLVYALVRNGTAVVTVNAELAELCKTREASFRDTRVFTLASDETPESVALADGILVYVLKRETNGIWRLTSPVAAPADQTLAATLVEKILKLKQSDLIQNENTPSAAKLNVTVKTTTTSHPIATIPASYLDASSLADLRSKTLLTLDPAAVRRLSVKRNDKSEIAVVYDATRSFWNLERPVKGLRASQAAVKTLLTALARVDAVSIETVAATSDDFRRCGLNAPSCIIAIDLDAVDQSRQNVILGGVTPGGGRYATVGGADAVFVVSKQTAAALMTDITE